MLQPLMAKGSAIVIRKFHLASAVLVLLSCGGFSASAQNADEIKAVSYLIGTGDSGRNAASRAKSLVRKIDFGLDGLQASDIDLFVESQMAQQRAHSAASYLYFDLNGDVRVTADEFRRSLPVGNSPFRLTTDPNYNAIASAALEEAIATRMRADTDGNGAIEGRELVQHKQPENTDLQANANLARALLRADPNLDGIVTDSELSEILKLATAQHSLNLQAEAASRTSNAPDSACRPMSMAKGSLAAVVSTTTGASLTDLKVGESAGETSAVTIRIEDGPQPINLILASSRPVIWQFTGSTARVSAVRVTLGQDGSNFGSSGVVGVDKSKVSFGVPDCPRDFTHKNAAERAQAESQIQQILSKPAGHGGGRTPTP